MYWCSDGGCGDGLAVMEGVVMFCAVMEGCISLTKTSFSIIFLMGWCGAGFVR
jgi:hypothetical protein